MTRTLSSHENFSTLNPSQQEAVFTTEGPVLVLAGAGTGKTKVLISRIAHLILEGKAQAHEILAVTFTNKAATEMKERTGRLIGQSLDGLWLGTFHSISARIMRRHPELLGLTSNFTILDTDDQERVIKQILAAENLDDKKQTARIFVNIISGWKDRGLTPAQVTDQYLSWEKSKQALRIYQIYQERLRVMNAVDFGDLLLGCLTIFRTQPEVLAGHRDRFKYILVDEYQDTNVAQYLWLKLLVNTSQNICCVGDDDQSIYGWRGAEIENILKFEKDFKDAKVIRLEQNYRSTPAILGAASGLIAMNKGRLGKTLWTMSVPGDPVYIKNTWDGREEARWIGDQIENYQRTGLSMNSMAILVRAGYQTREFEEAFIAAALPYKIVGGLRFYERLEIRDALSYLRLAAQPNDDLAFERMINVPRRGIGQTTIQKLHMIARANHTSLRDATESIIGTDEIRGATRTNLTKFLNDLTRWHHNVPTMTPVQLMKTILDESGYTDMWRADKSAEAASRLENLKELVAAMAEFTDVYAFLEHVSLVTDTNSSSMENAVTLMTMHAAKGLEFDLVFLAGWEEGVFPSQRLMMEGSASAMEEERRLAYVAITRAKRHAYISFATNRRVHGQWQSNPPSRFIRELPQEHVSFLDDRTPSPASWGRPTPRASLGAAPLVITSPNDPYKKGDTVFHIKFGKGRVQEVEPDRLTVNFEHTGPKKVLKSFITKT